MTVRCLGTTVPLILDFQREGCVPQRLHTSMDSFDFGTLLGVCVCVCGGGEEGGWL